MNRCLKRVPNQMDEQMVRALLELGKITFEQITKRALKIVIEDADPTKSWLAYLPPEILQAHQGVHGHSSTVAAARRLVLIEELGGEKGEIRATVEAEDPSMVFLLAGLAPPVDPIGVLLQCEIFVAAWKAQYEETKKSEHLSALALLTQIRKIKDQYRISNSGVSAPEHPN